MTREEAIYRLRVMQAANDGSFEDSVKEGLKADEPYAPGETMTFREFFKADHEAYDMAIKALEHEQRWIPVSERLPGVDCGEYVLISINGQTTMARISGGANWGRGVWSVDYCAESGEESEFYHWSIIDAWMPLPDSYKAEREG